MGLVDVVRGSKEKTRADRASYESVNTDVAVEEMKVAALLEGKADVADSIRELSSRIGRLTISYD